MDSLNYSGQTPVGLENAGLNCAGLTRADVMILIDERERRPFEFHGFQTRRARLSTADYTLAGYQRLVGVERKTAWDFAYYLGGHRMQLAAQAQRLHRMPDHLMIIECAPPEVDETPWRRAGVADLDLVKQTLRSWRARGVRIAHVRTHEQGAQMAADFLFDIATKYYERHRPFFELIGAGEELESRKRGRAKTRNTGETPVPPLIKRAA